MLGTIMKQPTDQLDYDVDFNRWLTCDDRILTVEHKITPENKEENENWLIVKSVMIEDGIVKVWLAGGESPATYKVTIIAGTRDGRIKEIDFKVRVKDC